MSRRNDLWNRLMAHDNGPAGVPFRTAHPFNRGAVYQEVPASHNLGDYHLIDRYRDQVRLLQHRRQAHVNNIGGLTVSSNRSRNYYH